MTSIEQANSPTPEDSDLARQSSQILARFTSREPRVSVRVHAEGDRPEIESVTIPVPAFRLLVDILDQMAKGNAVTVLPVQAELTTQQAAELLNVSRPFVIKLIEDKLLPCKMVGSHRRILFRDLMDYKRQIDSERMKVLDELAAQAQALGMGY